MGTSTAERIECLTNRTEEIIEAALTSTDRVAALSSFQTQSVPLLHILSKLDVKVDVFFLDTGFHFPETLSFMRHLSDFLRLDCTVISSEQVKLDQRDARGDFYFISDPDRCCHINKVVPTQVHLKNFDWVISGVRRDQSPTRALFSERMRDPSGLGRLHPMLEWGQADISGYIEMFGLPRHPLDESGVRSIGCSPCTSSVDFDINKPNPRENRWPEWKKTECGLHVTLSGDSEFQKTR